MRPGEILPRPAIGNALSSAAMKLILLVAYIAIFALEQSLTVLNLLHLKRFGDQIPPGFEGDIELETLRKSSVYTFAQAKLGLVESVFGGFLLVVFLFAGIIGRYDVWISSLADSFQIQGILFFLGLYYAQTVIGVPFSLYKTFVLEERHGFNSTTPWLWLTDFFKSQAIGSILMVLVIGASLGFVAWAGSFWWLWVWFFYSSFSIFIQFVSPYLIEPLFFKFEPVKDAELEEGIKALGDRSGISVSRVLQVDASKRSRHSNAYFTGIGKVKRIVLFDTLLQKMGKTEVLAVLAHEIGHWKKKHILKFMVLSEAVSFAGLYVAAGLLKTGSLPGLIELSGGSFHAQVVILFFLFSLVSFPFTPIFTALSRRNEKEADDFAMEMVGGGEALASALVKLSTDNLSNLHPHPLYSKIYYSHPPLVERVDRLRKIGRRSDKI